MVHRRVAIKQGGTLTLGGAYLWDLALPLEGLAAENESLVNWQDHTDVVVRMRNTCLICLRHSAEYRYDSEGFVGGEDIKNIEERGEDPKWASFTSYKIDYDGIKDSLMGIMGKYIDTGTPIEESYTRSYRRYRRY
jgi:hypothetical protein